MFKDKDRDIDTSTVQDNLCNACILLDQFYSVIVVWDTCRCFSSQDQVWIQSLVGY